MGSKNCVESGLEERFGFANHLVLIMSYKKWVHKEKFPNDVCLPYIVLSVVGYRLSVGLGMPTL